MEGYISTRKMKRGIGNSKITFKEKKYFTTAST